MVRSDLSQARTLQEEELMRAHLERERERLKQEERDRLLAQRLQQELKDRDRMMADHIRITGNHRVNSNETIMNNDNTNVKTSHYENLPVSAPAQYSPQVSDFQVMEMSNGNIASSSSSSSPIDELVAKDRQLAERIHLKEKMRALRRQLAKEKRQVAKLTSNHMSMPHNRNGSYDSSEDLLDTDLSDFCMKPPPGLSEEDARIFQEEQDAELARFLQRQETLKNLVKEKRQEIESHDAEIARMLHEQERLKLRRMKDKRRRKQQQETNEPVNERDHLHRHQLPPLQAPINSRSNHHNNNNHYQSQEEIEEELRRKQRERELSGMGSYDVLESMSYAPKHPHIKQITPPLKTKTEHQQLYQTTPSTSSQGNTSTFHNIAMDLDPTYKRNSDSNVRIHRDSSNTSTFHEGQIFEQQNQIARVTVSEMTDSEERLDVHFGRQCRVSPLTTDLDVVATHQVNSHINNGHSPVSTLQTQHHPRQQTMTKPKPQTQLTDLESLPKHVQPGHHRRSTDKGDKNKSKKRGKEDAGCKTQ